MFDYLSLLNSTNLNQSVCVLVFSGGWQSDIESCLI